MLGKTRHLSKKNILNISLTLFSIPKHHLINFNNQNQTKSK